MSSIPNKSGIYVIRNTVNGKFYIGQAQNLRLRWKGHKAILRNNHHTNPHLKAAWDKYGESAFSFSILEYCDVEQLNRCEQEYLDIWVGQGNCYNIARDAEVPSRGIPKSDEHKKKLSVAHKGEKNYWFGKPSPKRGKPMSEEQKQKLSKAHKGKPAHNKGIPRSEETKEKLRIKALNRSHSEETKAQMRIAQRRRFDREKLEREQKDGTLQLLPSVCDDHESGVIS